MNREHFEPVKVYPGLGKDPRTFPEFDVSLIHEKPSKNIDSLNLNREKEEKEVALQKKI